MLNNLEPGPESDGGVHQNLPLELLMGEIDELIQHFKDLKENAALLIQKFNTYEENVKVKKSTFKKNNF
jgi:hypothetical protein